MVVCLFAAAQDYTQTVRGKIVDVDTQMPLFGANLLITTDTVNLLGATTDMQGNFRIDGVSVGRHTMRVSYLGYDDAYIELLVTSGKEVIANVEMEESIVSINEVVVTATEFKGDPNNEMSTVSTRTFSVDETERYAGSRGDPARMVSNFAGVQGVDDSRNDIVVRGNTPLGVVYRFEGIDIPNPNHFAIVGSGGGPVSVLNNKYLANSDFFTGAFPAEYGNTISSVFDLRMKNGNNEQLEFSGQFGIFGMELFSEGPIKKESGSSFILSYRYATLGIFQAIGVDIGTDAVPRYQDAAFRLNFPQKNGSNLSFFGLGGMSGIDIKISEQTEPDVDFYAEDDRDQYFRTRMGVIGTSYMTTLGEKAYWKTTLAFTHDHQRSHHEFIIRHIDSVSGQYVVDSLYDILDYRFDRNRITLGSHINIKFDSKNILRFGLNADHATYIQIDSTFNDVAMTWQDRWDVNESAILVQPFAQFKHKFSSSFIMNVGLHAQYYTLNNSASLFEPRIGFRWMPTERSALSVGFGIHSQLSPEYTFFYHKSRDANGDPIWHNFDMDFMKSRHYVIGYDIAMKDNFRIKAEAYYQELYDVPVEVVPSSFSLVNQGSGFLRFFPDSLQNTGTGTNYGFELTLEKFFANSFYFLITGSYYESRYTGSDGIERSTDYNGRYAVNGLFGYEWSIKDKNVLGVGTKITAAGGKLTGPVDTVASALNNELIYVDETYNSERLRDYFRADIKINYRINGKKVSHEIAIDIVNLLDRQNILNLTYGPDPTDPTANPIRENYQLGRLPIFYYKIDF